MGEPQALEARAAVRLLWRRAHGEPARGHAEDLRADGPPLRLGRACRRRRPRARGRTICSTARCASQGVVSLDSICHLDAPRKAAIAPADRLARVAQGAGAGRDRGQQVRALGKPEMLDATFAPVEDIVHILNPFDPLVIQRKRLALFFGYEHRFEAYVPKEKRTVRLLLAAGARRRRHRRGPRSQDGPRAAEAAGAEMDLARQERARTAPDADRGSAAPLRAVSACAVKVAGGETRGRRVWHSCRSTKTSPGKRS